MTFDKTDIRAVGAILKRAATEEIMPRFRSLRADQIREKSSLFDLVTEGDEAAERLITSEVCARFPEAIVIGEEATAKDETLLERIDEAALAVIVDPIDGTKNFASDLPLFGVMAAVTQFGEVVASAILDPICNDIAYAVKGEGAWLEYQDGSTRELKVAEPAPVDQMVGFLSTGSLLEPQRSQVNGRFSRFGMVQLLRCAAHDYRQAAQGFSHVLFYNKLMPWDHAAGWLLHQEAGGFSAHLDGTPYRPSQRTGGLLCAPNQASWEAARRALFED
ncbi:inositol monophosphatase family protein [Larsenimonas salina]|uniref:inositol monophosphatase family protein n=1 Tax=Larsenimonas salina TaxID=1295565 RepID=UPI0020740EAE|nr:inositol monophosphatase [Larsenimonas salina]MCM5704264.1 inositol monophosphatase [Larsenimonas salina]